MRKKEGEREEQTVERYRGTAKSKIPDRLRWREKRKKVEGKIGQKKCL